MQSSYVISRRRMSKYILRNTNTLAHSCISFQNNSPTSTTLSELLLLLFERKRAIIRIQFHKLFNPSTIHLELPPKKKLNKNVEAQTPATDEGFPNRDTHLSIYSEWRGFLVLYCLAPPTNTRSGQTRGNYYRVVTKHNVYT